MHLQKGSHLQKRVKSKRRGIEHIVLVAYAALFWLKWVSDGWGAVFLFLLLPMVGSQWPVGGFEVVNISSSVAQSDFFF